MRNGQSLSLAIAAGLTLALMMIIGCGVQESPKRSGLSVPAEFANRHMPEGWWNDSAILEEGRQLYLGVKNRDVNCASCHGRNGRPVKSGARDFRDNANMKKYSDSYLFWRISEGIPFTRMRGFKDELTEEQIWKVVAFVGGFGLKGLKYDPIAREWVPAAPNSGTGPPSVQGTAGQSG